MITFPLIGEQLAISTSSAKTYWRRALMKCADLWESSNPLLADMIGGRRGLSYNEEEAKKEVDKTVLLCTRCHAEVHDDMHKEKEEEWLNNYGQSNLQ